MKKNLPVRVLTKVEKHWYTEWQSAVALAFPDSAAVPNTTPL